MNVIENDTVVHHIIDLAEKNDVLGLSLYRRELEQKGINPDQVSSDGYPAVLWCLSRTQYECLEPLFIAGFSVNIFDAYGSTFFRRCVHRGEKALFDLGVKYGGDINLAGPTKGETPLHVALTRDFYGVSKTYALPWLLEKGANVNAQDHLGVTPLMTCITQSSPKELVEIMSYSPDLSLTTKKGYDVWKVAEEYLLSKYVDTSTAKYFLEFYPKQKI